MQMQIRCLYLCQSVVMIAGAAAPAVWISVEPVGCGGRPKQEAELVGSQKAVHGTWTWEKLAPCMDCCRRVGELALQHALALTSTVPSLVLQGYQDLGIFPASASKDSLAQMRMGFELKHTDTHKQLHKKQAKAEAMRAAAEQKQAAEAEKWARERRGPLGRSALAVAEQPVAEQPLRQSQRLAGRAATEPPSSQAVPGAQPHAVQACMSHMVNHVALMNVLAGVAWDKRVMGQSILELLCNYRCVSDVLPGPHIMITCRILTTTLTGLLDFAALGRICEWPLDVVVTDGRTYHTLRLRGNDIQVVLNLGALDGLRLIAARLRQVRVRPLA